jgi:hypothetical protein
MICVSRVFGSYIQQKLTNEMDHQYASSEVSHPVLYCCIVMAKFNGLSNSTRGSYILNTTYIIQ